MSKGIDAYWCLTSAQAFAQKKSSLNGLSSQQVIERRSQTARSRIGRRRRSRWTLLVSQFTSPIILLLIAAAFLSFVMEDTTNGVIVMAILTLSGAMGYWQERSAADAVARLLKAINIPVSVRRDGHTISITREELVMGDVVLVKTGTVIPADCLLVECNSVTVDESVLTGESFPVEKQASPVSIDATVTQRSNCLFLGTHVTSGHGTALVMRMGLETEFGKISDRLERQAPRTDFETNLRRFGSLLVVVTAILVVLVFLANVTFERPAVESLLFALALAVGMTPQLLPAITSVVLANGAKLMAKSGVIIKRLVVIENFGAMDTLCMDKTGTITTGTIELHQSLNGAGITNDEVLQLAYLNASLQSSFENPIDCAVIRASKARGLTAVGARCLAEIPYDFQRKLLSVLVQANDQRVMITKGAYANVVGICSHVRVSGKVVPLEEAISDLNSRFQAMNLAGYRVLAVATRNIETDWICKENESQMTLVGFLTFADPLKSDIHQALSDLSELGIQLKLVTGDSASVARTIASRAGFTNTQVITGSQIRLWNDDQIALQATQADIFAEVEPNQKEKIVLALRKARRVVGFLGDGINDAPALHAADVGISVSTAVEVSREAAQVVLMRSDLTVLSNGVREGRRTLANTLKYIYFAISANFGYMLSMAIASLFLPFLPLLPAQILLINLLADFPAMAMASDRVDPESIAKPRRWEMRSVVHFMLTFGLAGTCSDFATFATLLYVFNATPEQFRVGWFTVSVLTGLLIMLVIRTSRPFLCSRPGKWLVIGTTAVATITLALPYTPIGPFFALMPPAQGMYFAIGTICISYLCVLESLKRLLR